MTSAQDFVNMQVNMRHNQSELTDFLSDLKTWETDIKRKDDAIRSIGHEESSGSSEAGNARKGAGDTSSVLPPVRNPAKKVKKKEKSADDEKADQVQQNGVAIQKEEKKPKIKSYDYRAWDKFDVDKACKQIDSNQTSKPEKEQDEYETDEEAEEKEKIMREKQKAVFYKDQGNKCFKNGKISDAIIYYTKGLEADPTNALLYSNRAMANLKQEKYQLVVQDCDKSIQIDATYHKSFLRRGTAHSKLGNISEAEKDFRTVLELVPDNKEALVELNKLKLVKENQSGLANSNNIVMPVKKPIGKRSKVPLRRIAVEEVKNERPSVTLTSQAEFIKPKDKSSVSSLSSLSTENKVETTKVKIEELQSVTPESIGLKESHDQQLSSPADIGRTSLTTVQDNDQSATSKKQNPAEPMKPSEKTLPQGSLICPDSAPSSSIQFITDFRRFQQHPEVLYQYLCLIEPTSLPKLIPHSSFDAKVLMSILIVLRDFYIPDKKPMYQVLLNLTQIKRFSTIAMFLSKSEKQVVVDIFDFVNKNEQVLETDLIKLKKLFSL